MRSSCSRSLIVCLTIVGSGSLVEAQIPRPRIVRHLAINPDGTMVVASIFRPAQNRPGTDWGAWVTQWDVTTSEAVTIPNAYGPVAFSPDGKTIAMGIYESNLPPKRRGRRLSHIRLALWRLGETEPFHMFQREGDKNDSVVAAAFSQDGKHLVALTWTGKVLEWTVKTQGWPQLVDYLAPSLPYEDEPGPLVPGGSGDYRYPWREPSALGISMSYSSSGDSLLLSCPGELAVLWNRHTKCCPFKRQAIFKRKSIDRWDDEQLVPPLVTYDARVVDFVEQHKLQDKAEWCFRVRLGRYVPIAPHWMSDYAGRRPPVAIALTPDAQTVAVAERNPKHGGVTLRRLDGGEIIQVLAPAQAPVAFTTDGKLIATAGGLIPVSIWNVETGERVQTLEFPKRAK